jgi:hypothetical protein
VRPSLVRAHLAAAGGILPGSRRTLRTQLMFVAVAVGIGMTVAGAVGDGVALGLALGLGLAAGGEVAGEAGVELAAPWPLLDSRSVASFSLTSLMPTIRPTAMVTIRGRAISMIRFLGRRSPDQPLSRMTSPPTRPMDALRRSR